MSIGFRHLLEDILVSIFGKLLPIHVRVISFLGHLVYTHECFNLLEGGTDIRPFVQYRKINFPSLCTLFLCLYPCSGDHDKKDQYPGLVWAVQNLASDPACPLEPYNQYSPGDRSKSGHTQTNLANMS